MLKIIVNNQHAKLYGPWNRNLLDRAAAYTVHGGWFAQSKRDGRWDGRKRFYRKCPSGYYKMPTGFVEHLCRLLDKDKIPYQLDDFRDFLCADPVYEVDGKSLSQAPYDYQAEIVDAACATNGGVIHAFTGAGKTVCAAAILKSFDAPGIFLVHRLNLLHQAHAEFEAAFGEPVGIIGDGLCRIEKITVAMVQTLDQSKFNKYLKNVKVLIADEVHHLESEQWMRVIGKMGTIHRYGMTATPSLVGPGKALIGYTGPIIYSILPEEGIRRGVLVPPEIYFIDYDQGTLTCSSQAAYSDGIAKMPGRTKATVWHTKLLIEREANPLILVRYLNHAKTLMRSFEAEGMNVKLINSKISMKDRKLFMKQLENQEIDALIGQVQIMGEGVDMPRLRGIINATGMKGGGSSASKNEAENGRLTMQILGRGLRCSPGKEKCYYFDFNDTSHPALINATNDRQEALRDYGFGQYFRTWADFLV